MLIARIPLGSTHAAEYTSRSPKRFIHAQRIYIVLILMYRIESFKEAMNTYPTNNKLAVPKTFRTTLNVFTKAP
jgi:hypothetical protein